jgi:hypothetical protein
MDETYPTEEELLRLTTWDCSSSESVKRLLAEIERMWWMSEWGYKLTGTRVLRLQLHTGGWSGNESIIEALQGNFIFWSMSWIRSQLGGHYWFKIILDRFCVR